MKIFQTIPTNPFFSNRIVSHIRYTTPIIVPFGYSNYSAPSFPALVVGQPLFHSQTFGYQPPFSTLNSHPPIANYHLNNHFGQFYSTPIHQNFYSSPIPQNFYSIPQILHYPTLHQIPTILTSYPVNQTLFPRMPHENHPKQMSLTNHPKKFREFATQTVPQDFIDISNSETQVSLKGILNYDAQNLNLQAFENFEGQPSSERQIKSELSPLPIVAKALKTLTNYTHNVCHEQLSELPQEERYC